MPECRYCHRGKVPNIPDDTHVACFKEFIRRIDSGICALCGMNAGDHGGACSDCHGGNGRFRGYPPERV